VEVLVTEETPLVDQVAIFRDRVGELTTCVAL
jgi:hypothetical protein